MDKFKVSELIKENPRFSNAYFHNCFFNKITVLLQKSDKSEEDILDILLEMCTEIEKLKNENLDLKFFINMIASKVDEYIDENGNKETISKPFSEEDFKVIVTKMNGGRVHND